ncbi:MAG: prepilin-type N-terminal cleavage/methylation domain-containing protein [Elusimicrobiaceae bacterium]|nr:prepilin-type N-terminal cleavage/methylation domain-containing protein [Elusimicrobiaceae bacterium]
MKKGFTLIELLVVVLIIGILSAVALPQYTKAVRKARISEARVILRALANAEDLYILEHGESGWTSWEELSIETPTESKNWTFHQEECITGSNGKIGCGVYAEPKWERGYSIEYWSYNYDGGDSIVSGKYYCNSWTDEDEKICKSLGIYEEDSSRYLLN